MSFTSTSIEYKTQRYLPHVKLTTKCELCALTWVESHCRQRVQSACASQLFADDVVPARCKSASAATSERQGRARRSASVTGIAVASTAVGLRGWHSLRRSDYGSCLLLTPQLRSEFIRARSRSSSGSGPGLLLASVGVSLLTDPRTTSRTIDIDTNMIRKGCT